MIYRLKNRIFTDLKQLTKNNLNMKTTQKRKASKVLQVLISVAKVVFAIIVFLVKASFKFIFFVLAVLGLASIFNRRFLE